MNKELRKLVETAIFIALAVGLDLFNKFLPIFHLPMGGSFSLAMLPVLINGYRNGLKYGLIGSLCYSLINFLIDGYYTHLGSFIFDYLLAFGILGLSGLFRKSANDKKIFIFSIVLLSFIRFLSHTFSGFLFFSEYSESKSIEDLMPSLIYSLTYNGPYMLLSCVGCVVIGLVLHRFIFSYKVEDK